MKIASNMRSPTVSSARRNRSGNRPLLVALLLCVSWPLQAFSTTLSFDGTANWVFDVNHFGTDWWTNVVGLGLGGGATIHVTIDTSNRTPYNSFFGGVSGNFVLPDRYDGAAVTGFQYAAAFDVVLHGWDPVTGQPKDVNWSQIPGQWLALTDQHGVDWDVAGTYYGIGLPMCVGGQSGCSWLNPPALLDTMLIATSYSFDGPFPSRVPEPGTLALLGLGLLGMGVSRSLKA